jgi:hypothetical protein
MENENHVTGDGMHLSWSAVNPINANNLGSDAMLLTINGKDVEISSGQLIEFRHLIDRAIERIDAAQRELQATQFANVLAELRDHLSQKRFREEQCMELERQRGW